ncbi:hypothetical protein GF385_04035 [Candidatus Dependentiae bacterium]|nr:hypothetical protein [Candidatus Dependentiae bacterium]
MQIKSVFLIILCFFLSCINISCANKDISDAELMQLLDELFDTPAISQNSKKEEKDKKVDLNLQKKIKEKSEKTFDEFINHLNSYYPKVFVIREKFFSRMTPEDLAKALKQIIDIIANKPWFYLEQLFKPIINKLEKKDKKEWQKSDYDIEFLIKSLKNKKLKNLKNKHGFENFLADQLVYFHNFLKFAKVDINKLVYLDKTKRSFSLYGQKKNSNDTPLKKYWFENGEYVHFDFYELCADYWSRLFINSIISEQLNKTYRYYEDLKEVLNYLKNSPNESKVNEYLKRYKNLLKLLKQKKSLNNQTKKSDDFSELLEYWDS